MLVPRCRLPSSILAQAMLSKYILPDPLSSAGSFEGNSLNCEHTAPKKLALRLFGTAKWPSKKPGFIPGTKHHIAIRFTVLFPCSQRTKSQHSCPGLVESFATLSSTKMCNYLIASVFRFFAVTWICAVRVLSAKRHWLPRSVCSCLRSPFPKTVHANLGREGRPPT